MSPNLSLLPNLMISFLDNIKTSYAENNGFSDNALLALYQFFGNVIEKAIFLVETDTVKRISLKNSTRFVYQVTSSSNRYYYIFPNINFCQCPAFTHFVLNNKSQLTCKHVLSCHLAEATTFGKSDGAKMVNYELDLADFVDIQKSMISLQGNI